MVILYSIVPKYDFFGSFNGILIFWKYCQNQWLRGWKSRAKGWYPVSGWSCGRLWYWWRGCCSGAVSLLTWRMTAQAASLPRDGVSIRPDLGSTITTTTIFPTHHQSAANTGTPVICRDCRGASAFNLLWFCHLMPVVWRGLKLSSYICSFQYSNDLYITFESISSFFIVQNVEIWLRSWMINVQNNPIKK